MAKLIRKCRLADSSHRDVDLRIYEDIIIETINKTVPGKHPSVHKDCFLTDKLNQSEAVALGRALAKIDELIEAGFSLWEIEDYIYYGMEA
jgi:hypothetical protein